MDIKSKINENEYDGRMQKTMPKSKLFTGCLKAFLVGGAICTLGELIKFCGSNYLMLDKAGSSAFTSVILIFLGALFTGIGVYDILGRFAGAGSIVPITGFANSIVAPALEFKREGYILGVGAKLFTIAGPVLVYGITASVIAGIIYCIMGVI